MQINAFDPVRSLKKQPLQTRELCVDMCLRLYVQGDTAQTGGAAADDWPAAALTLMSSCRGCTHDTNSLVAIVDDTVGNRSNKVRCIP